MRACDPAPSSLSDEELERALAEAGCRCHLEEQRFLVAGGRAPARKQRPAPPAPERAAQDRELPLDEDLIRVLALRPQLAPRPRDNILLEGQMELLRSETPHSGRLRPHLFELAVAPALQLEPYDLDVLQVGFQ